MTVVSINLDADSLETFYAKVFQLPYELAPDAISDSENNRQFPITFDRLKQGDDLPIVAHGGYFLHAPDAKYSVSGLGNEPKIFVELTFDKNAEAILKQIASIPINYAYACKFEEREHQNRIMSKKSYGAEQVWVGRAYQRYLPGMYWLNLVPKSLLDKHGITQEMLNSVALSYELVEDRNYFIQLYPSANYWKERIEAVDAWRRMTPGVFHKAEAQNALNAAKTFMESSDVTSEWK